MNKKLFYMIFMSLLPLFFFGQNKQNEKLYINFKENSIDTYWKKGEMGKKFKEKSYLKNEKSNGDVDFFVEGLMFRYDKSKMETKTMSDTEIECIKLLTPQEILNHINSIQEKYPLGYKYPSEEFPKMFIVNKNKRNIILYEVKCQYYIE